MTPNTEIAKFETEIGLTIFENQPMRLVLIESREFQQGSDVKPATWRDLMVYARANNASLPTRIDGLMLFERVKDKFKTDLPYWTCEEYTGDSPYAWGQWFDDGLQRGWRKATKCRACLVRRFKL